MSSLDAAAPGDAWKALGEETCWSPDGSRWRGLNLWP